MCGFWRRGGEGRTRGLRGFGRHGVLASERANGQPFLVDVELGVDTRRAAKSDDLSDTVDYAGLADRVVALVEGEPVNLIETLADEPNDLEAPAVAIAPVIADVLAGLRSLKGCKLARMSGSGATCYGLFGTAPAAAAAARALRSKHPAWWIRATKLG